MDKKRGEKKLKGSDLGTAILNSRKAYKEEFS